MDTAVTDSRRSLAIAGAIFVVVASVYVLTSPGRVDIIDGLYRYEAAKNLLWYGEPFIVDPSIQHGFAARANSDGVVYGLYGLAPSVAALPWMAIAHAISPHDEELLRFAFSLTSPIFGGGIAALLWLAFCRLGVSTRRAFAATAVASFATLIWPVACSTFDQAQHGFWVLATLLLADRASRVRSSLTGFLAGCCSGIALNHQEALAVLAVPAALALLPTGPFLTAVRACFTRLAAYSTGVGLGVAVWAWSNFHRFGHFRPSGTTGTRPVLGNPLLGAADLLLSPGSGILFYSATIGLALVGMRALWSRAPRLALAAVATALVHFCMIASLAFHSGGWCWGPRYLVVTLPLLCLGLAFAVQTRLPAIARRGIIVAGITTQLLGLSLEPQRFFFERGLGTFFYETDRAFYFRESSLLARPGEILATLREGVPPEARTFGPYPPPFDRSLTYTIFGYPYNDRDPFWVRRFAVFHLPRPWPLWMPRVAHDYELPIRPGLVAAWLASAAMIGCVAIRGLTRRRS